VGEYGKIHPERDSGEKGKQIPCKRRKKKTKAQKMRMGRAEGPLLNREELQTFVAPLKSEKRKKEEGSRKEYQFP